MDSDTYTMRYECFCKNIPAGLQPAAFSATPAVVLVLTQYYRNLPVVSIHPRSLLRVPHPIYLTLGGSVACTAASVCETADILQYEPEPTLDDFR